MGKDHKELIEILESLEASLEIAINEPTLSEAFNLTQKNRLTTIHQSIAARNTYIRKYQTK